jgi:hypothetical protein
MTRARMVLLVLALFLPACNGGVGSEETRAVKHTFQNLDQMSDVRAAKSEILQQFTRAGLDPKVLPTPALDARMQEILDHMPQPPLDRFMLGVDGEAVIAIEFPDTDLARWAEREDTDGFRYRNWYFHGRITVEVTRKMQDALQG